MIKEVKLKDKTMSVILTSLLVLTIAFLVPAVAFAACGGCKRNMKHKHKKPLN